MATACRPDLQDAFTSVAGCRIPGACPNALVVMSSFAASAGLVPDTPLSICQGTIAKAARNFILMGCIFPLRHWSTLSFRSPSAFE